MAAAARALRAVALVRSVRAEAAVADFVFERCTGEVGVEIGKRRLGDVGKRLVCQECLMGGDRKRLAPHRQPCRSREPSLEITNVVGAVVLPVKDSLS